MQIHKYLFSFFAYNFCDDGKHYDVCYFVLKMFVMMRSIGDV